MKVIFIWLLLMHDHDGDHRVTGFFHENDCRIQALELTVRAGDKRGMSWSCERQGVEK